MLKPALGALLDQPLHPAPCIRSPKPLNCQPTPHAVCQGRGRRPPPAARLAGAAPRAAHAGQFPRPGRQGGRQRRKSAAAAARGARSKHLDPQHYVYGTGNGCPTLGGRGEGGAPQPPEVRTPAASPWPRRGHQPHPPASYKHPTPPPRTPLKRCAPVPASSPWPRRGGATPAPAAAAATATATARRRAGSGGSAGRTADLKRVASSEFVTPACVFWQP